MSLTREFRAKRRAMLVRRWAAYRIGRAQREIWRKKRQISEDSFDEGSDVDLLAELPDELLG